MISLARPLVFFDLETTGIDVYTDRIIQIAAVRFSPDSVETKHEWITDPGIPISKEASEKHGFTDEMVKGRPRFGEIVGEVSAVFEGADLGGYNIKQFDIPLLAEEFLRVGYAFDTESIQIVDSYAIWRAKEPRTLAAALKKYCDTELEDAHNAIADVKASLEVFLGQRTYYADIPDSVAAIHELCFPKNPDSYDGEGKLCFVDGVLTINFGKNKGRRLQELAMNDPSYLEWILRGSFSSKVKEAVRKSLGRDRT